MSECLAELHQLDVSRFFLMWPPALTDRNNLPPSGWKFKMKNKSQKRERGILEVETG